MFNCQSFSTYSSHHVLGQKERLNLTDELLQSKKLLIYCPQANTEGPGSILRLSGWVTVTPRYYQPASWVALDQGELGHCVCLILVELLPAHSLLVRQEADVGYKQTNAVANAVE